MNPQNRYEIHGQIAAGDFATVYRARDLELGREVAVKQIHPQYLADPAQLDRYWQEAQLLASLHHPYIVTIYDIVRDRGWLILELMQGSVKQQLAGQPCPLDFLRVLMVCSLHALKVLEQSGIVHGDVKPGNLLLDASNRVKLGDFGIARRATGDDGSLLKGTTKYMAPEVVSDQFGPVGPQSDLYSLGFTAYELMCGDQFETLFPGLDMFGRDRQIAWMMWHAAGDRRLPEIPRVLDGVPDDLAHVIGRLTEKDPSKRYRSADEALFDLREKADLPSKGPSPEQVEAEEAAAAQQKKKRLLSIGALAASVILSMAVLFMPSGGTNPPPAVASTMPDEGIVRVIDEKRSSFNIEPAGGGDAVRVAVDPESDRILIDEAKASLAELQVGDRVSIVRLERSGGESFYEISVLRELAETKGSLGAVGVKDRVLSISSDSGSTERIYVPTTLALEINGSEEFEGRPVRFSDLKAGDAIAVRHKPGEGDVRHATSVRAKRIVPLEGYVVSFSEGDPKKLTVRLGLGADAPLATYPLAAECQLSLNGSATVSGSPVQLNNLRQGDFVEATHDTEFHSIAANREHSDTGVVAAVEYDKRTLYVKVRDQTDPTEFKLADDAKIVLMANDAPARFDMIRPGDAVLITHDSAALSNPVATSIQVDPLQDKDVWAIVIGQQQYDDSRISSLSHTEGDARAVRDALLSTHRVPAAQVLFEVDATRLRLEQAIPEFLAKAPSSANLVVYFAGHGYLPASGVAVLATQEFDWGRMDQTGLSLRWLLDQLEACPAREKVLLLDTCHAGKGDDLRAEPSSQQLAESLKKSSNRPVAKTVTVIASCAEGQRGRPVADGDRGIFAQAIAAAIVGAADTDRDRQIDAGEYFAYLQSQMAQSASGGDPQTPVRFLPDPTPARLSDAAQAGVKQLLSNIAGNTLDATAFNREFEAAESLAPDQPDFKLAAGLVLLKHGKTSYSAKIFKAALVDHPGALLARHGSAWQQFARGLTTQGLEETTELIKLLPAPAAGGDYSAYARHLFYWAGELRAFLGRALPEAKRPEMPLLQALDDAILARGDLAKELYTKGFHSVGEKIARIDAQLAETTSANERTRLEFDRRRLTFYTNFDFAAAEAYLLSELDR
jgi:serine/threonine-protein kinase